MTAARNAGAEIKRDPEQRKNRRALQMQSSETGGLQDAWQHVRWLAQRSGLMARTPWNPDIPDGFLGFNTSIDVADFMDACVRLNARNVGELTRSVTKRSVASVVEDSTGRRSWLKVSAIRKDRDNWLREGEHAAAALEGIPKPAFIRSIRWSQLEWDVCAFQTALAPGQTAAGPWAERLPARVSDRWIADLAGALATLRPVQTPRWRIRPEEIAAGIKGTFGEELPHVAEEWITAHGDLHWSNLTVPELNLIDWEWWGLAPRGFDEAYLLTHSCTDRRLVERLQDAFADQLHTGSGRVALLWVLSATLHALRAGSLDPLYLPCVEAMARKVLASKYPKL